MKKIVNTTNIINGMTYSSTFYSDETMNAWIAKQELKCASGKSWGWGERNMPKDECPTNLEVLIAEEYEVEVQAEYEQPVWELDGNGDPVTEEYTWVDEFDVEHTGTRNVQAVDGNGDPIFTTIPAVYQTWVRLNPEYQITITDVTTEYEAELAEKEARATEIAELKQAYNIINGWTSMGDINLTFLKKFFIRILKEMRD